MHKKSPATILDLTCNIDSFRILASFGLAPGRKLRVLINKGESVLLVEIDNSIVALSKEIASKILVSDDECQR